MALRRKTGLAAAVTWGEVRLLEWIVSSLFGWRSSDPTTTALVAVGIVVLLIVIDEIDGIRIACAREFAKLRVEANREAIVWLEANGGLEHLQAALDGWNEGLHAKVVSSLKQSENRFAKRVSEAALKGDDEENRSDRGRLLTGYGCPLLATRD